MDTTTGAARTRRALLTAALGAGAATVATAVVKPLPASADDGGNLVLGTYPTGSNDGSGANKASAETGLWSNSGHAFHAVASAESMTGVWGETTATSGSGNGVAGRSLAPNGNGVFGSAEALEAYNAGVAGRSLSLYGVGVWGHGEGSGIGVLGITGPEDPFAGGPGPSHIGVYGISAETTGMVQGVVGQVISSDAKSTGVEGLALAGIGVLGITTDGVGVYGRSNSPTAYALRTNGRVRLDKAAGTTTISAGTKSKLVTPGTDVTSASIVIATLNGSAGGTITVHRVALDATNNQFRIYLTGTATKSVKVAWIILN